MLKDIKNGLAGNGIMPYKGVKSLWIYSDQVTQNTALIMIIPFDVVTQLAEQTQKAILDENINQQRQVGVLVLIVLILAIALSIRKAKTFTTPINKLADAANRLADGDYSAKADINTGDELQQLAEIFKQIGPKLLEH